MIGDIDACLIDQNSTLRSFADDSRVIRPVASAFDMSLFQNDLNSVYNWAAINKMSFNDTKFEVMRYNPSNVDLPDPVYYSASGNPISFKTSVKDLGIMMSNTGNFSDHIIDVSQKMIAKASWICRTFKSRSKLVMLSTWKSLVIPIHDYCSQLWFPWKIKEIQLFEKVQWYFLQRIYGVSDDYWLALKELQVYSLQRRRERYVLFYIWKVLFLLY